MQERGGVEIENQEVKAEENVSAEVSEEKTPATENDGTLGLKTESAGSENII